MAEKSQDKLPDTSAFKKSTAIRNPLLSVSVTNFDHFPKMPILLPPAPPPNRESPKPIVTVGESSDIDSECLDEINLNAAPTEDLGPAPIIDTNTNTLQDQSETNDSILSQAASSFSALPSVASSVLSTFSKRIYAGSSREQTPNLDNNNANQDYDSNSNKSQPIIQPSYVQHNPQAGHQGINQPFYAPSPPSVGDNNFNNSNQNISTEASAVEPPKFYTPQEVPILPAVAPPSGGAQNTYRLSAKKKLYAPIPGLSDQAQPVQPLTAINTAPSTYDSAAYSHQQDQPQQEERKGALFSLTNLVPTGVLQNITGLVQTATGTLNQSNKPEQGVAYGQPVDLNQANSANQASVAQPIAPPQVPFPRNFETKAQNSPTNIFAAPPTNHTAEPTYSFEVHKQIIPLPPAPAISEHTKLPHTSSSSVTFFNPASSAAPPLVQQTAAIPQHIPTSPLDPSKQIQTSANTGTLFNPVISAAAFLQNPPAPSVSPQQVFSNPSFVGDSSTQTPTYSSGVNLFIPTTGVTVSPLAQPYPSIPAPHIPVKDSFVGQASKLPSSPTSLIQSVPTVPTVGSSPAEVPQSGINLFSTSAEVKKSDPHPPTQPPPQSVGQTSFRLQKGTRLYKSPLTAAETTPLTFNPQQQQPPEQHTSTIAHQPPTFFNPFAASVANESVNPLAQPIVKNYSARPPLPGKENLHLFDPLKDTSPELKQGIKSFVEPVQENTLKVQSISQLPSDAEEKNEINSEIKKEEPSRILTESSAAHTQTVPIATAGPKQTESSVPQIFAQNSTSLSTPQFSSFSAGVEYPPQPPTALQHSQDSLSKSEASPTRDTLSSTLSKLTLKNPESETQTSATLPPPPFANVTGSTNPYRKGLGGSSTTASAQPALASFFTPNLDYSQGASGDFMSGYQLKPTPTPAPLTPAQHQTPAPIQSATAAATSFNKTSTNISNFFNTPSLTSQEPIPPVSAADKDINIPSAAYSPTAPEASSAILESDKTENSIATPTNIPPPIGFDNILENTIEPEITETVENTSNLSNSIDQREKKPNNAFSNFFGQTFEKSQPSNESRTKTQSLQQNNFFDSFGNSIPSTTITSSVEVADSNNTSDDQVLQNFFNNPPQKENSSGVGDLQYDLVHSGLGVRTQHTGSLTTASNVVEPPSSACSEFSELNNSTSTQRIVFSQGISTVGENNISPLSTPSKTTEAVRQQNTEVKEEEEDLLKKHYNDLPAEILEELRMANDKATATPSSGVSVNYCPAVKHWFYKRLAGTKHIWTPFSHYDSALLETSFISNDENFNIVAVEGGRYDVNIRERLKRPVYWEGEPIEVRRCSWFFKATDSKLVPYEEASAQYLEEEYKKAAESGVWHKKIIIGSNEQVVFHGPTVIVHFQQLSSSDNWGGTAQTTSRPRVVKRDLDDFTIEQGESQRVDHLLLMVHGIGSACDLKMRSVEEVVDDFRTIARQLVQSHYKNSTDMGIVGRVEVLPISWHSHLHSEEMGIDEKLKSITLESIPRLRNFTNDTLLDILFYTSPTFCQKIITTVVSEMNTVYMRYRERHPEFNGGVSLAGHSLGSLILFDILCHQQPIKECEEQNMENLNPPVLSGQFSLHNQENAQDLRNITSKQISYTVGSAGTGQPFIQYAQLIFQPKKFFALGSPIGMFVTIRGIDKLGLEFGLPTCPAFYNIFHPFDPVAYRIEALVNPDLSGIRPVLIPHHKGRKRMHLELKETMTRVGADLKQRFFDTFKNTLESVNFLGSRTKKEAEESIQKEVDKVIAMQMELDHDNTEHDISNASADMSMQPSRSRANSSSTTHSDSDLVEIDFPLGKLNDGKRIDYVLQEAPLEFFNEYLFALSSHVCYWESSDTILFVMKEIYSGLGISPDSQVPQQTMTIERPNSRNSVSQSIIPPTN